MSDVALAVPSISTTPAPDPDPNTTPELAHEHHPSSTVQYQASSPPPASTSAVIQPEDPAAAAVSISSPQTAQTAQTAAITTTTLSSSSEPGPSTPTEWGRNFWVTLVDPQSGSQFYACPSTGETTWDAPVGHFVLPPSSDGEWWELQDETRGGMSYYYHTKTGETTWDKPDGFVIPLGVVQNTTLGRRLSQSTRRHSQLFHTQPQSEHSNPHSHSHFHTGHPSSSSSYAHPSSPSSFKTRRTQRHPHAHIHGHGPPSVISERTEEVTEDAGFSSGREKDNDDGRRERSRGRGGREKDKDKERARTPSKQHTTPTRPPLSASASSHQQNLGQHHHTQPSPSPSRFRTKSQPSPSSSAAVTPSPGQSLTAAAEYIVSGGNNATWKEKDQNKEKDATSNKPKQNGLGDAFVPAASSSPARRTASASASATMSTTNPLNPSSSSTTPSTSTLPTNRVLSHTSSSLSIVPEFSKIRKVPFAGGVGVGTGTSMALMHAGVSVDGTSSPRQGTFALPRPQLQPRSLSASTPPSHVASNVNGGVKGKRDRRNTGASGIGNLVISPPVLDIEKTIAMSHMQLGDAGAPIHVYTRSPLTPSSFSYSGGEGGRVSSSEQEQEGQTSSGPGTPGVGDPGNGSHNGHYLHEDLNPKSNVSIKRLSTGPHPLLPRELVSDIQQFAQSDFTQKYFATHKEGIFFRRRVPLEKMMSWQKAPLTQPLLLSPKLLHKDATKAFKSIQRIMGDRDRDRSPSTGSNGTPNTNGNGPTSPLDSTSSLYHLHQFSTQALLEEERMLLSEGLSKGETLRDEIYCQVMKQLSGNPSRESTFRGWQLFCVLLITFPPSKTFEPYVRRFLESHTGASGTGAAGLGAHVNDSSTTSRIDLMARHCLTRLDTVSKRGPRGKPPSLLEIEIASDAAFNPSTFGEPLPRIFKIQQRTYPALKIPIVLPFLTDGILALGGTKTEGIFRVSGDAELVSELRLRIDRGVYTLDGIDDPHVLASLLKLWLRELREPLIPTEMYNQCVACSPDPERCVEMVKALPTLNRRVVLFVISFLQLFLDDRIYRATKMSAEALSLVIAPNLMRCASDVVGVVVNNSRYEQQFICNILLHLRCGQIDPDYVPEHGRGALSSSSSKKSSSHGHGQGHGGQGHNRLQPSESSSGSGTNANANARKSQGIRKERTS